MSLFAVTTFVVFHFALNKSSVEGDLAAGILWVTLLFAAILGANRLFVADAGQGGFDGFLLAPVDPSAMLAAKVITMLDVLVVLELVAVPALPCPVPHRSAPRSATCVVTLALADIGIAVIGTLVGTIGRPDACAGPARAAPGPPAAGPDRHRRGRGEPLLCWWRRILRARRRAGC